jgi:hypothetical protein
MKRHLWLAFFVLPALAFGLISDVAAGHVATGQGEGENADEETGFTAVLSGANEVPALPGSDLKGTAQITINLAKNELCWELDYTTTQQVTAAHIHKGAAGVNGGVVFGFFNPPTVPPGVVVNEGCRSGDHALLADIANHPGNYYANVHTTAHPGGAARGQLVKEADEEEREAD